MATEDSLTYSEEAQRILQTVAATVQQEAHSRIAGVVSRCLEYVFEDPYEFRIEFEEKRGRTEANLVFVRNGNVLDPLQASGGGAIDVASFALRLACLVLSRPALRRLLVLDEPFKNLSAAYRPKISSLLGALSAEMGVQILMVTHDPVFQVGKVVEL